MTEIEWPDFGPDTDVYNHIASGYDMAANELLALPEDLQELTERIGRALVEFRFRLVLEPASERLLELDEELLEEPWVRFAADLEVAGEGIRRASLAIDRYLELELSTAPRSLPKAALPYIREVAQTFIFSFDPGCIALCRAALEQVLRDVLVRHAIYTDRQLRRDRPTAGTLIERAKQEQLLRDAYDAAQRVRSRADTLMHSHMFEPKILKGLAHDSVRDLSDVLRELLATA